MADLLAGELAAVWPCLAYRNALLDVVSKDASGAACCVFERVFEGWIVTCL